MNQVHNILRKRDMQVGPSGTLLYPEEPEVIHIEMPLAEDTVPYFSNSATTESGDIFIFPSGTIVSWGVPRSHIDFLRSEVLAPAARKPLGEEAEDENLEYSEDSNEERSLVIAEKIVLGTKSPTTQENLGSNKSNPGDGTHRPLRTVLAKIAFSSGLARATKLAVLENLVDEYSQSSRSILSILMHGSMRLKSRKWVYEKIGQLLDLRAQLNLYSELADDLPDLFWDTKHELGLESYYDQISKALDTRIRIKTLNQKMDYAEEIISNLRDMRSEIHSSRLEWIIIGLITFEVLYAIWTEAFRIPARHTANTEAEVKPA
ncbi:hypothetical protein MMC10_011005 [Thelotrema lepadinum]|nr:hypothetical protein [Thelotrema lepadinum]